MTATTFPPGCIQTYSGQIVDLQNPDPKTLQVTDMSWALSHLCRYTGHIGHHYSVGQHSVLVASEAMERGVNPLAALLHDAAEAYLGDVSSPLKALLPAYVDLETLMQAAIEEAVGLPAGALGDPQIADCDVAVMAREIEVWFAECPRAWSVMPKQGCRLPKDLFRPWSADATRLMFMTAYRDFVKARKAD